MNQTIKRTLAICTAALLSLSLFAGCGGESAGTPSDGEQAQYTVGILQFSDHGSLDNCRTGFLEGLASAGIEEGVNLTVQYQNAQNEGGVNNQIAQGFVSDQVDLICAIATPSAQAAYNYAEGTGIPVIYTAVTDPVEAKLANADGTPTGNATGTSDKLAVEQQLQMIRTMMPEAKTIGILYTTGEVNSLSSIEEYKQYAGQYGFEIVESGVTTTADIPLAVDALLPRVDCLTNLTDNTVVSSLDVVLDKANAQRIPVFGSEIEQVQKGCVAAMGLDYVELGRVTGQMAARVLKGEAQASEISYEVIEEAKPYVNSQALAALGLSADGLTDAIEVGQ